MEQNIPSINNLLDELEDLIEGASAVPFTHKVSINPDDIADLIAEMRTNLPKQVKQAEKIISNCKRKVDEANNQAQTILEQARTQAQQLTSEHEITQLAQQEAENIIDAAYEEAKALRLGAKEYVKDRMAETEERLNDMLEAFSNKSIELQSFVSNEVEQCYRIRQGLLDGGSDNVDDAEYDDVDYDDDEY